MCIINPTQKITNQKIIKAEIGAAYKRGSCGYYEFNVWYSDTDPKSRGCIKTLPLHILQTKIGNKWGYGFKKIQKLFNTEEGRLWLETELLNESSPIQKVHESLKDKSESYPICPRTEQNNE